jgi:hypothetical protein
MQTVLSVALILSMLSGASARQALSISGPEGKAVYQEFHVAGEAHKAGHLDEEISIREHVSKTAWEERDRNPESLTQYDLYGLILENDLRLALLLEGTHRWGEAEQMFLHNQTELARMKIAGNDIKSENQLLLAHLLASEGKTEAAGSICSHWRHRMRHLASGQDGAHIYGTPVAPITDTPEVETAKWDLACGKPEEGLSLLAAQIAAHPHMLASYDSLSNYYCSEGDIQKARQAEVDGASAVMSR